MTVTKLVERPVTLEEALDIAQERAYAKRTPGFPPITDTITWFNHVDWSDVRVKARAGVNNVGLVVAVIGSKLYDLGQYLAKV
jgi:hypothetical protein